jgi:DNA polymerase III epsilon subunit-like protein
VIIPFRRPGMPERGLAPPRYAVVDVETTGFSPWLHDRVIEIAVVRIDPDKGVLDEYCTLVNPNRDVGRTDIHGIRASDVRDAPTWNDIAGDVGTRIQDAIVAAHNLRFDVGFLISEFTRVGISPPPLPGLCTLRLARQLAPGAGSYKLAHCCMEAGVEHEDAHSAVGDARATAHLLACYLKVAQHRGITDLADLGCENELCASQDRARMGADPRQVFEAHHKYMSALVRSALVDGVVTPSERSDLELVCDLLGLHRAALDALLAAGHDPRATTLARAVERLSRAASAPPPATIAELRGRSVCFTGTFTARLRGQTVTREEVERMAAEAGMEVRKSVTKKLDLLVASDVESMSSKAKRASELGIQVIDETAFWKALGAAVDLQGRHGN